MKPPTETEGEKMSQSSCGIICFFCSVSFLLMGFSIGIGVGEHEGIKDATYQFQQQAIDQGYAEFNSETGEWQWKSEE